MFMKKISSQSLRLVLMTVATIFLSAGAIWAQNIKVTGTVTDKNREPLIGVYVLIQGTQTGTSTEADGTYSLTAPANSVLVFSSMGYQDAQEAVNNRSIINVTMQDDALLLDDVVVTAMGIKKEKKALGYAVQDIKGEEILRNKNSNVINSLNGKIAGLNITNSGGGAGTSSSIVIRGGTSLERDNQPLFIIDGMAFDNSTGQGDNSGFDGTTNMSVTNSNRAMDINPEDIESISVLKGPAAAALYGLRAAAGAIVITTKKGKEGNINVSFGTKFTSNWANKLPEQQSSYKRGSFKTGVLTDQTMASWGDKFADGEYGYNNLEDFLRTGNAWDNNVSVSGGGKNNTFYLSASRFDQTGIVPNTDYVKNTFRFNGEQKYGKFTFGANASYMTSSANKTLVGDGLYDSKGTGAMKSLYGWPIDNDARNYLNADGSKFMFFPEKPLDSDLHQENPYWIVNRQPMKERNSRFIGSLYATFQLKDWLNINYKLGADTYTTKYTNLIQENSFVKERWWKGMMSQNDRSYEYLFSNLMITLTKTFWKDWNFNLVLGHSLEDTRIITNSRKVEGFEVPGFYNINNGLQANKIYEQSGSRRRLMGLYGDFRLSYKNIAYLSVTGRNDWSSTLPVENRSFFYPSVSGSFVFSELLPKNNILSFAKVRASWAKVGKDASPYVTNSYVLNVLTLGEGYKNDGNRGNPYLKPETTESMEFGLEMRFLNGRIGFDAAYYDTKSYDQILNPRVSQTTGYYQCVVNTGTIRNKGIELSINAIPVQTKKFTWDMTFNISGNRGRVLELPGSIPALYLTDVQPGSAKGASFNDGNFMGISGKKWTRDDQGRLILDPTTKLPITDNNANYEVGNREPKLIGGWFNNFSYKGFELSFLLDFRVGGDIYNGTEWYMTAMGTSKLSEKRSEPLQITGVVKGGTQEETYTITDRKIIEEYYSNTANSGYLNESANFITDVNWLRLRSLSLTYNFSKELLKKTRIIKGLSVSVSGNNLFVITNYKGMDPETSAAGAGVIGSSSAGIDYCNIPSTMGVTVGLNINF